MADDPYKILGVKKEASADEIRSAYRKLAKKHHPDLNPGNKAAEETFKSISGAYDLLSDAEKRGKYDRGEIDASGAERPQAQSWRQYAEAGPGERYAYSGAGGGADFEDLFGNIFNQRPRGPAKGRDRQYSLEVGFLEAVSGATRRITLPDGGTLDVKIPPGTEEGDILRLRGKGDPGAKGGPDGDALIEIHIAPHKFYRRLGRNIHMEVPVSMKEAVLGAKITLPTPAGDVAMTIRPGTESGTEMRLRGRGVPAHGKHEAGDLHVKLNVVIGPADAALKTFLEGWEQPGFNPREGLK
ncbi:DnaJ C-terminal domain-containing protein [Acidocella sp. MX-AZ02]|uniref:DnaJ C-terminal domain-containing protein n=1 Tax=Acidocella sp. MX-AZ02 TaxID=1214225 RepID=UPI00028D5FDC|nr:J domain-containing protein [Acidocella sp. MX-AZ02]EKN00267.1 chaperone DnaJ domain-containing protein [Acidocella sp. MX-AZ02]